MYCVIQEIELKKPNKRGHPKELISDCLKTGTYWHHYSEECFERPIKKAYKVSIHISYREAGKVKKKQYPLCTMHYYDIADGWFSLYDYCSRKIENLADSLGIDTGEIYDLVEAKLSPLIDAIQSEFHETEEYKTHEEHERITTLYAANKAKFNEKYGYEGHSHKYDEIYDVFGNLMNKVRLDEVEENCKYRQEYEEKSRSYQKKYYSNYSKFFSGGSSGSYSDNICCNHSIEDKETLKQFYRELSKKFHPDANPDKDTSKEMKLLNQLKSEWDL